jgi:hypothetical protein
MASIQKYNEWEIKQILDVVSKGVNSVLMNSKSYSPKKLRQMGVFLMELYKELLDDMKTPQEIEEPIIDVGEEKWDEIQQEIYKKDSELDEINKEADAEAELAIKEEQKNEQ